MCLAFKRYILVLSTPTDSCALIVRCLLFFTKLLKSEKLRQNLTIICLFFDSEHFICCSRSTVSVKVAIKCIKIWREKQLMSIACNFNEKKKSLLKVFHQAILTLRMFVEFLYILIFLFIFNLIFPFTYFNLCLHLYFFTYFFIFFKLFFLSYLSLRMF